MRLPCYQVDAFTSRVFGGNPAAVVLLDDWLPDELLAAIAAENNLAETAFVIPRPNGSPLRWFTPTVEVDLCGHATLATAHVLFTYRFTSMHRVIFETHSGTLTVTRSDGMLHMDFPARPGQPVEITDHMVSALGRRPREGYLARDLMVIFESESDIKGLQPDPEGIASLNTFAVIVTAPGSEGVDFVSRFFAPRAGIPEDPATGSSHCTLVPYWANRLGKNDLVAKQLSARGGDLVCKLNGDRVSIGGHAVEYLRGEIALSSIHLPE